MELLAEHNRRVREKKGGAPKYVPMKHSIKDVKEWEKSTGKKWYSLGPRDREIANNEIRERVRQRTQSQNSIAHESSSSHSDLREKREARKKQKLTSGARTQSSGKGSLSKDQNVKASRPAQSRQKSDANSKKRKQASQKTSMSKQEIDLLAAHNRKIRRKSGKRSAYEPLKHRMSDVKMWERKTGKRYYDLNPEQREEANAEITLMLKEKSGKILKEKNSKNRNKKGVTKRRRPSLSDVYRTKVDPRIFDFRTPASEYKDIDAILQAKNFDSIHDDWFQRPHEEILKIPESLR